MTELYVDTKKNYWVVNTLNDRLKCELCIQEITRFFSLLLSKFKNNNSGSTRKFYCENCIKKTDFKEYAVVKILCTGMATLIKKSDFVRFFPELIETQPVRDASGGEISNLEVEKIKSITSDFKDAPLSRKGLSWEGASVGKLLDNNDNKVLDDEEFNLITSAVPEVQKGRLLIDVLYNIIAKEELKDTGFEAFFYNNLNKLDSAVKNEEKLRVKKIRKR